MNKTKCIRVMPLALPDRDLKGEVIAGDNPEFQAQQEKVFREKLAYLRKKIRSGESAPIGPSGSQAPPPKDPEGVVGELEAPRNPLRVPRLERSCTLRMTSNQATWWWSTSHPRKGDT